MDFIDFPDAYVCAAFINNLGVRFPSMRARVTMQLVKSELFASLAFGWPIAYERLVHT